MKSIFNKPLQIASTIYGLLYFLGFALPVLMGNYTADKFENISVLTMFFLFAIGLIYSWFNDKIGGLLFQFWYLGIWILSFFFWPDAGMVIVLSVPILFIGIFMYQKNYRDVNKIRLSKQQIQRHLLNVLILNYAILYTVSAIPELFLDVNKYMEYPMLLFPFLYLLFIIAFIFSWKKEKFAGILLIVWYLIVAVSTVMYSNFANEGPLVAMGIPLLVQGINLAFYKKTQEIK
jgi:hypothetical protein